MLLANNDVMKEIETIKRTISDQDQNIQLIFEYLKQLEQIKQQELEPQNRKRVGYKQKGET